MVVRNPFGLQKSEETPDRSVGAVFTGRPCLASGMNGIRRESSGKRSAYSGLVDPLIPPI